MSSKQRINKIANHLQSDSDLLTMVEQFIDAYHQHPEDPFQHLPDSIKHQLKESIWQAENEESYKSKEVIAEARAKYGIDEE